MTGTLGNLQSFFHASQSCAFYLAAVRCENLRDSYTHSGHSDAPDEPPLTTVPDLRWETRQCQI